MSIIFGTFVAKFIAKNFHKSANLVTLLSACLSFSDLDKHLKGLKRPLRDQYRDAFMYFWELSQLMIRILRRKLQCFIQKDLQPIE